MTKKKNHKKQSSRQDIKGEKEFNASENADEYLTVADCEKNEKYRHRRIENNWKKYEGEPDVQNDDEDDQTPSSTDFTFLVNNASSDCSHFQFSFEKLWQKSENHLPPSKLFNLDLDVLSAGLACLPLYERLNLDKSELAADEIEFFDKEALQNQKQFNFSDNQIVKKRNFNASNDISNDKCERKKIESLELFGVDLEDYFKSNSCEDYKIFKNDKKEANSECDDFESKLEVIHNKTTDNQTENQNAESARKLTEEEQQLETWLLEKLS